MAEIHDTLTKDMLTENLVQGLFGFGNKNICTKVQLELNGWPKLKPEGKIEKLNKESC